MAGRVTTPAAGEALDDSSANEQAPDIEARDTVTPAELEVQHRAARDYENGLIAQFQNLSPTKWRLLLSNRLEILEKARWACIETTVPEDWTLFRGPEGDVNGVPRKSGCVRMRKIMGITVSDYRPKGATGDAEPDISHEESKEKKGGQVTIVTMLADGYCHLTGETIDDVRHSVRSDESFTGRGTVQDLIQSCRTGLDSKVTRILSDTVKVPESVLKEHGIETERCYKGHGFGTSKDRLGKSVADEGITEQAGKLAREILSRTGGDKEAARQVLVEITKNEEKKFKGFDSVERFTKQWQLDGAWERLKKHPVFGDEKGEA